MKIYDCSIFFNENLLTEIRLNLLDEVVDYFVICESYYDHRGKVKGYLFDQNKFIKFKEKIIYLKIDKFHLIGFSIGALVAIEFATNYEKYLNSLTLISTTYKRSNDERQKVIDRVNLAKKNMPISQMAMKRWFSDDYLKKNPDLYEEFLITLNKEGVDQENFIKAYELFANYQDSPEKVKKIKTNTLIIAGSEDTGSTPNMSKNLNKDIQNSQYLEIKNGKHFTTIEYADEVNNAIMEHLNNA